MFCLRDHPASRKDAVESPGFEVGARRSQLDDALDRFLLRPVSVLVLAMLQDPSNFVAVPEQYLLRRLTPDREGGAVHIIPYLQTLDGPFSAVSKPNFSSKYSCESSRRDLHNATLCTVL